MSKPGGELRCFTIFWMAPASCLDDLFSTVRLDDCHRSSVSTLRHRRICSCCNLSPRSSLLVTGHLPSCRDVSGARPRHSTVSVIAKIDFCFWKLLIILDKAKHLSQNLQSDLHHTVFVMAKMKNGPSLRWSCVHPSIQGVDV